MLLIKSCATTAPASLLTSTPEPPMKMVEMFRISLTYVSVPPSICLKTADGMYLRITLSSDSLNWLSCRLSRSMAKYLMVGNVYFVSSILSSRWKPSVASPLDVSSMTQSFTNSQACGLRQVSPFLASGSAIEICSSGGPAMMYSKRGTCVSGGTAPPTCRIVTWPQPTPICRHRRTPSTPVSNMCSLLWISMQQADARSTAVAMGPRSGMPKDPCGGTCILDLGAWVSSTAGK
mmetsp:Transcript_56332/g.171539  ORF Transcript_56332/g.171539 Transcript_56332/m.171539 type:complete len:234 (-) Transcript_56332:525-1226(-)